LGLPASTRESGSPSRPRAWGSPSAAIVVEELADLGVRTVIRLGTCGAIAPSVDVLDIVIATAASPLEGTTRQYVAGIPFAPAADFAVVSSLVRAAAGKRPFHVGGIVTQDAFYLEDAALNSWQALGVLATEMETSAIFTVSALRGMRAGSACLVVDRVNDPSTWVSESEQDVGIEDLMRIGLEAALALQGGA
jgi:purine-nucleoside phosphorylase